MYNNELKKQFIDSYSTSESVRNFCLLTFNAFEKYEEKWGSDLCTQDSEVLEPIVNEAIGIRHTSKRFRFDILCDYVKWCIENNVPGACDGMLNVDTTGVEKMKRQTVTSPYHLQEHLDSVFDKEIDETVDNIYRCYCWLAYGGALESEAMNVRTKDVDFDFMVVKIGSDPIPIYRESIQTFRNCKELDMFAAKNIVSSSGKTIWKYRADGDLLLRGVGSNMKPRTFRNELAESTTSAINAGKTKQRLSYKRIWMSGIFYRMYEKERAGIPVDFSDVARHIVSEKTYNLQNARFSMEAYIRRLSKEYSIDYESWKKTFK